MLKPTLALGAILVCASAALAAPGSGELWEVTSQMSMDGMPAGAGMPARTSQLCTDKGWTKPPVAQDKEHKCEILDWNASPTISTWKIHCAGPPAMQGNGEITRSAPDAYKGFMQMSSEQGAITIRLTGKKIGDCDAEQARVDRDAQMARVEAQVAAGEKMAADVKHEQCMAPVKTLNLTALQMQAASCAGPSYKAAFCEKVASQDGFEMLCVREKTNPQESLVPAALHCGADATAIAKAGCEGAVKDEDLEVIGSCCPVEAKTLAAKECAGRKYTELTGSKYQGFCASYGKDVLAGAQPAASPEPESTKSKAKKALKGIFGK